jgi:AraC family transcriptional regulator
MDYYPRLARSIEFIEENLSNPISLVQVSETAYSSLSHFHRIFAFMTGFTMKAYIRKRRLSVAAHELICTDQNVLDIALKYQYQTHETFTRAFYKEFGMNPGQFRKKRREHVLFEKIDIFRPEYKNRYVGEDIGLRFVTYNEFTVSGFGIDTTLENDQVAHDIPGFMETFFARNLTEKIPGIINPRVFYGIYSNLDYENNFRFTIAYETGSQEKLPQGLERHLIPPRNYAVFTANGPMPESQVDAWHYIYGNWLPNSPYEREKGVDFEVYDTEKITETTGSVDIYIPLKIVDPAI